ncbi:MAG: bacillithiol system redox-active protein YtxJ [Cytophagaceae bacterium]
MEWKKIVEEKELDKIIEESKSHPVLIFKHSTRCSVSSTALSRLERSWVSEEMKNVSPYFLDLLSYRNISNLISETFKINHESPQALLIKDGNVVYHASHLGISYSEIKKMC